jgi:hypothetical protein
MHAKRPPTSKALPQMKVWPITLRRSKHWLKKARKDRSGGELPVSGHPIRGVARKAF